MGLTAIDGHTSHNVYSRINFRATVGTFELALSHYVDHRRKPRALGRG